MNHIQQVRFALSRRRMIQVAGAAAVGGFSLMLGQGVALAETKVPAEPFRFGVAAGDPTADGFVIWTKLAPQPMAPGFGMPRSKFLVRWEVAEDPEFKTIALNGEAEAWPDIGHSVHVEIAGLKPARPYFYRFRCGDEQSLVGQAKTLPLASAGVASARFGVCGCQRYEDGSYIAHRKLAEEELDFVYFYGDYIYEREMKGGGQGRMAYADTECFTLDDYRRRYALGRVDADLQANHAAHAWFVTWDDHEVINDWVSDKEPKVKPPPPLFNLRRQAAVQAFYEFMPLRPSALPVGTTVQLFRRASFGRLMDLQFLDTRQFRTPQPCGDQWDACDQLDSRQAEVLGLRQEKWLYKGLAASKARWNVLAQQVMVMDLDREAGPKYVANPDSWGGYRTPRARLLNAIRNQRVANPIILTGDEHLHYAGEVHMNGRAPGRTPVAVEFVTTSVSSGADKLDRNIETARTMKASNETLKLSDGHQGYSVCDVTAERWVTEMKVFDQIGKPGGQVSTVARGVVQAGSPRLLIE